jgi:hypothetical protein
MFASMITDIFDAETAQMILSSLFFLSMGKTLYCLYYLEKWRRKAKNSDQIKLELQKTKENCDKYKNIWINKTGELEKERKMIKDRELFLQKEHELNMKNFEQNSLAVEYHNHQLRKNVSELQNIISEINHVVNDISIHRSTFRLDSIKKILSQKCYFANTSLYWESTSESDTDDYDGDPDWLPSQTDS